MSLYVDIATIVTGIAATVTAFVSLHLSRKALVVQETHNKLSMRPIPFLALADYENTLRVRFLNDGAGPFIVIKVEVFSGSICKNDLISWMDTPPKGLHWSNFTSLLKGRAVLPNNELFLLELKGDDQDPNFANFRDQCRDLLANLTVKLTYTDSYNTNFPTYERSLDWFAREKGTRKGIPR